MDEDEETELWWIEFRVWPFAIRFEAEVLIETRNQPGMHSYQCHWNDIVAFFWKIVNKKSQ